jgi:hypothetical protein
MFTKIDGAWVTLRKGGVYRQAMVYDRTGELYAKYGSGFVALTGQRSTSVLDLTYEDLDLPRLYVATAPVVGRVTWKYNVNG